ncbi:MAG: LlaJI family restriction endonuclease [Clostridia bacterium]|nr:LlaJI family restriction endonuclease [Clostridia bacterium]
MMKIRHFHPHKVTGKADDQFVGLKIIGSEIHFYYPESYRLDMDAPTVRNDIIDLLRTVTLAKTPSTQITQAHNTPHSGKDFALVSYLWVIHDFCTNGFYVNREKRYATNQTGRVHWKKTMQTQPIISDGNIIYPYIVTETKSSVDNILVEIHKYCVKKSIDHIGWLFNLTSSFIETAPFHETTKKLYIATLNQELNKTFDDDKRLRLWHLKNVIVGLDANDGKNEVVYGVDSYHYVYEKMIDAIFGNVKDLKEFLPSATWHLLRNHYARTPSSKLRPDTLIVKGNDIFILDAKFYRFGYTGKEEDLPETTSIQKQITYGDYIQKNVNHIQIRSIYNAFLLPYDKTREVFRSDDDIQYVGFAGSTWKDNNQNHELIHTFLIDLYHVVKTWNRCSHETDVAFLIDAIQEHQRDASRFICEHTARD